MLKGQWGSAKRLALVAATAAVALSAVHCARIAPEGIGHLKTWTQEALATHANPVIASLDDLVNDGDGTELAAQTAMPNVAFGFENTPEQAPAQAMASAAATPPTSVATLSPAEQAQALIASAKDEWKAASDNGFFRAARHPNILASTNVPSSDANVASSDGVAAAVGEVVSAGGFVWNPKMALISDIRVSPTLAGVAISDNDPVKDIQTIVLHEGWHAEVFESPDLSRFDGALLRNDPAAQTFWKSAVWSSSQVSYKAVSDHLPELGRTIDQVGPNLSNIYAETGADSAAFTILAHSKSEEEWTQRLLHTEGIRAEAGVSALKLHDPHETQESLAILASIGYAKLRTLSSDQARALIDAVGTDGALLAAAKQGWAPNARTLADAADVLVGQNPASFDKATGFMMEKCFAQVKPAAQAWVSTPADQRAQIASHAIGKVQSLWQNGGTLDYSYIAPGLVASLPAHGTAPNYEVPTDPAQVAAMTPAQKRQDASQHHMGALDEWKGMAETLHYTSPEQAGDLGDTQAFRMASLWTTREDRQKLAQDPFWSMDITAFVARLDAMTAARAAAGGPRLTGDEVMKGPKPSV